jgi:hypothetical protein
MLRLMKALIMCATGVDESCLDTNILVRANARSGFMSNRSVEDDNMPAEIDFSKGRCAQARYRDQRSA